MKEKLEKLAELRKQETGLMGELKDCQNSLWKQLTLTPHWKEFFCYYAGIELGVLEDLVHKFGSLFNNRIPSVIKLYCDGTSVRVYIDGVSLNPFDIPLEKFTPEGMKEISEKFYEGRPGLLEEKIKEYDEDITVYLERVSELRGKREEYMGILEKIEKGS